MLSPVPTKNIIGKIGFLIAGFLTQRSGSQAPLLAMTLGIALPELPQVPLA
jgi:hypothetical protein